MSTAEFNRRLVEARQLIQDARLAAKAGRIMRTHELLGMAIRELHLSQAIVGEYIED